VSSTGAHGANRLASNSLLEAAVYAARIADDITGRDTMLPARQPAIPIARQNEDMPRHVESSLRNMMTSHVGVIRDGGHLAKAIRLFADIERNTGSIALRNMATTALLVAASAWSRRESRGAHCRSDHPKEIAALARRTMMRLADAREVASSLADLAPARVGEPETV
jgi:L-aspartate oxidase